MATKKNLGNIEEESEKQEASVEVQDKEKNRNGVLKDEIGKLRSDVDKISQELKSTVNELKKSIVDIRSAVSEIENPFNLLRSISSEEDLKKLNKKRLPPGVKSLVLGKPETEVAPENEKFEQKPPLLEEEKPEPRSVAEPQPPPLAEPEIEELKPQAKPPEMSKIGTNYLGWVWSLLDSGMSADEVLQLAQAYEFMGYLPSKSSEHIYFLAVACEKVRSKGFSKNWMLLNMYRVAVISGIRIGIDDVEKIISIAEGEGGKRQSERTR
jgi:hypothetical protein